MIRTIRFTLLILAATLLAPIAAAATTTPLDAVRAQLAMDGVQHAATIVSINQSGNTALAVVNIGDTACVIPLKLTSTGWVPTGSIGGAATQQSLQRHNIDPTNAKKLLAGRGLTHLVRTPAQIHPPYHSFMTPPPL